MPEGLLCAATAGVHAAPGPAADALPGIDSGKVPCCFTLPVAAAAAAAGAAAVARLFLGGKVEQAGRRGRFLAAGGPIYSFTTGTVCASVLLLDTAGASSRAASVLAEEGTADREALLPLP